MVKEEKREEAMKYLNKAEEFLAIAKIAFQQAKSNVASFVAIQAIINANDALTVFFLGKRASMDHKEAIDMHVETVRKIQDSSMRSILHSALSSRSEVGYSGKVVKKEEAGNFLRDATRFVEWVKKYVK
ncbi:MAG: HEPN domain-containing protein [Candidatus Aenigmarchaeota archaeon]|nr:HEPN domain-containing protein [Candidatus Aenigmarchaeota archaeon]